MILARLILGLLSLAPMTGYELKKHFDSSINHFWNADKAQIYRTLAQLVKDGHATVTTVAQRNYPDRQEHHITDAGREALVEWLGGEVTAHTPREDIDMRAAADRRSFLMAATLDNGIRHAAAELEWLEAVMEYLP